MNLSKLGWYWHRLRAMSPREVLLRLEKKRYQRADRSYQLSSELRFEPVGRFPLLPQKQLAPKELVASLSADVEKILRGEWKAFGHLPLQVSDPPRWQADSLLGKDLQTTEIAFKVDHRAQPDGADIKVIWEPSRWNQLVRLALAAWLLEHSKAQEKCIEWLHDWVNRNPPFTGLNWTSGLETGIRLIQYTWIDAFLEAAGVPGKILHELRGRILPPHFWYTWRYKSFGSSANNHLIGELAGLIIAQARWPDLERISAHLPQIGALMEKEIDAQFAQDGGNKEQALGYHLFSWEFCFQAQKALEAAGHPLSGAACDRLTKAAQFYRAVKGEGDRWDFGDSDNAWVTPFFSDETKAADEWWRWFGDASSSPALRYFWGDFMFGQPKEAGWEVFADSGYGVFKNSDWLVRFDFSPLGYLSMAPHGHLDALHLSVSFRGQPIIIDPGTGAYYADKTVRSYFAGWSAHNSPQLSKPPAEFPKRFGTFLWSKHHKTPVFRMETPLSIRAELQLPYGRAVRTVSFVSERNGIAVKDEFHRAGTRMPVLTRWKFSPELKIERAENGFRTGGVLLTPLSGWKMTRTFNPPDEQRGKQITTTAESWNVPLDSLVSPAFRSVSSASYLALESIDDGPWELLIVAE